MADNRINILATFNGKKALQGINNLERSFNRLKRVVGFVIANKMIKDIANFGREMNLMAERTGMSIEKLSSLRNVFISAGSGAKGFQQTIDRINTGLLGLKRGEGALAAQLAPLGISPFGKTADQILLDIADGAQRQLAMGRSRETVLDYLMNVLGIDQQTASLLMQGRQAFLDEQSRLEEKVGIVKSTENLDALKKAYDELNAAWTNAKTNIMEFVAPILIPILDALSGLVKTLGEEEWAGLIAGITVALAGFFTTLKAASWVLGLKASIDALVAGKAAGTMAGGVAQGLGSTAFKTGCMLLLKVCAALGALAVGGMVGKWISEQEWFKDAAEKVGDFFSGEKFDPNNPEHIKRMIAGYVAKGDYEKANMLSNYYGFGNVEQLPLKEVGAPEVIYSDEPLVSDEDYERPVSPKGDVIITNHFEGATFGSDLPQTEVMIGDAINTSLTGVVQGIG